MNKEKHCLECETKFFPSQSNQLYCRTISSFLCKHCGRIFRTECSSRRARYCSSVCSKRAAAKSRKKFKKSCILCREEFVGEDKELYCKRERNFYCEFCGDFVKTGVCSRESIVKSCDSICRLLKTSHSSIELSKLSQFKKINEWAVEFRFREQRKPGKKDVCEFFGVKNLPYSRMELSLFSLPVRDSFLELIVCSFLKQIGVPFERRVRDIVIDSSDLRKNLELDIVIGEFGIAFEVQDVRSHSRYSDSEVSEFRRVKSGPLKHELKSRLAREQLGLKVIELWEEDILSGEFKKIVEDAIESF